MRKLPGKFAFVSPMITFASLNLLFICAFANCAQNEKVQKVIQSEPAKIVSRMTLEQKVGQLIHVGMPGKKIGPAVTAELKQRFAGGVILFGMNLGSTAEIKSLNASLQKVALSATGIPLFISADQEGGRVRRVDGRSVDQFPGAMAVGQTGDPELAREVGFVTAYKLREVGINIVLAPVLDVNNNPANPVINTRSFGSETKLVTNMGKALAAGIRQAGSTPTIKHFPGHGDTARDSHLTLPRIDKTLAQLEEMELVPFRSAIDDGAEIVMSAHILFPSLDPKYPATLSPSILKNVLREKLKFGGLIMTDAMEMHAISKNYDQANAAKQAFRAGADIILLTSLGKISRNMYSALLQGFRSGELSVTDLDAAVERQIALKLRKGLFYKHRSPLTPDPEMLKHYNTARAEINKRYRTIQEKYNTRGVSLNTSVSRASISSLRKPFPGLGGVKPADIRIFTRSATMRARARERGYPAVQVQAIGSPASLIGRLKKRPAQQVWVVEIPYKGEASWNKLAAALNARARAAAKAGRTYPMTVALHHGNPFAPIAIPASGAVLESFSPTLESLRALIDRALDGKPVRKAKLILGGDDNKIGPSGFPEG